MTVPPVESATAPSGATDPASDLAHLLDALPDGVALLEADGRFAYCNAALRQYLGLPLEAFERGLTLLEVTRLWEARGDVVVVDGRRLSVEERVARVLDRRGFRAERQVPDGSWIEFVFRPLPGGRTLCLYRDVSESKARETALQRAREEEAAAGRLLQTVLGAITDGVTLIEPDGHMAYVNESVWRMLHVTRDNLPARLTLHHLVELQEKIGDHVVVAGRRLTVAERVERVMTGGHLVFERRMPTGQHIEFSFLPLPDGRILGLYRDFSELKKREDELARTRDDLAAAQQLTSDVLKGLPMNVAVFDSDHRLVYSNGRVGALNLGLGGRTAPPVIRLEDIVRAQIANGDHLFHETGRPLTFEERVARAFDPNGSQSERQLPNGRIINFSFSPIDRGYTLALVRDVTDVRERENELARARDELASTERLLSSILKGLPLNVAVFGPDHRLVYSNARIDRQSFNLERGAMYKGVSLEDIVRAQMARGDHLYDETGQPLTFEERVARVFDPRGSQSERRLANGRYLNFSFAPLDDGYTLSLVRDVTDVRQREVELERARDAAEAANQAKSTFLATISHEIRTPMNGVIGTAELLEREPLSERQRRLVRTVRTSAAALLRIIDDVLDFSKIEAGRMELEAAPFPLRGVVEGTCETLSVQAEQKGLALGVVIEPGTPDTLIGDATRLRQILFNLVGNALKFTDRGEVRVTVRAAPLAARRVRLELVVADTGIGMSEEQRERLFQPFSQADNSTTRRYGGTGLGLSIVRRLAELMGGGASVASTPGCGSTFTVTLELALAEPAPAALPPPAPRRHRPLASVVADVAPVLAVDDYSMNLEVLRGQCEVLGVPLVTAASGLEALTRWRSQPFALVLTDIHMPDMDGFELTRQIRAEEALAGGQGHTPIVALTANALKGEADRCAAAGMDGYLTKPLTLDRLRAEIERWLHDGPGAGGGGGAAASPDDAPIDRSIVGALFGDEPAMVERVLRRFADAGAALVAELEAAATGDRAALAGLAHKLKGAARAAGAVRLGDLAGRLEQTGDVADVAPLRQEWRRVRQALS